MATERRRDSWLAHFSRKALTWTGSSYAFSAAVAVVLVWAVAGPIFHYSDTWQLVINTGTTIVTFWMVFLIQRAQNNDARAVHMKLDEIIAALNGASSRLIKIEESSEAELDELQKQFEMLRQKLNEEGGCNDRHSVEELLRQAEAAATRGRRAKRNGRPDQAVPGDVVRPGTGTGTVSAPLRAGS